ncbi:hypothetical protein [Nostocoides sp. HKS02]|uniref:hypothetical protein n=1 Tax=Nostocoides sp. HKS02 TaxID=1813880 RepID=UPI0012B4B851|nr:hypothetical protein [Tetrasphaera sp. HKS02]QGN58779.1 hypothetical protein GKE56_13835 [Tetrasphaera sp. HKS02]
MWAPDHEDLSVRQYRFLLRTAPLDAMEEAHVEVLERMAPSRRVVVLQAVQRGLVAGLRLTPDDVRRIAHLIVLGERRSPGDFLSACPQNVLIPLAEGVIVAEASFGRFGGYAGWDGTEPAVDPGIDDSPFAEPWHVARDMHVSYNGPIVGPSSPDTFGVP